MLYILSGTDNYAKERFAAKIASERGVVMRRVCGAEEVFALATEGLFGVSGCYYYIVESKELKKSDYDLSLLEASGNIFFFDVGDKKHSFKLGEVVEFKTPLVHTLPKLIKEYISPVVIDDSACAILIDRLFAKPFGYGEVVIDTLLLYKTLDVLKLCGEARIDNSIVSSIVPEVAEKSGYELVEYIVNKNESAIKKFLSKLFSDKSSNVNAKMIPLIALLSDNLRGFMITYDLNDDEILGVSGYKSGRIYMMRKHASKFKRENVKAVLEKLSLIDEMLKTSQAGAQEALTLTLLSMVAKK